MAAAQAQKHHLLPGQIPGVGAARGVPQGPDNPENWPVAIVGTATALTASAVPGGPVTPTATGLIPNAYYIVSFADGADLARGFASREEATISGTVADASGSFGPTQA